LELSLSKAVSEDAPIGVTNAKASGGCAALNYTIEDKVKSRSGALRTIIACSSELQRLRRAGL
jgi:hypothetical protein